MKAAIRNTECELDADGREAPRAAACRGNVDGVSLAVDEQQGHVGSESAHSKYANVAARGRVKMRVENAERASRSAPEVSFRKCTSIIGDFRGRGKHRIWRRWPVTMQGTAYNRVNRRCARTESMEAERVNQIANLLSDLQQRAADLRRYL